jgi:hypothetical protein
LALLQIVGASSLKLRQILEKSPVFDEDMFKQLLVRKDLNHLLLSDINKLVYAMAKEFPEVVRLKKIGHTRENRDITLIVIDARHHLMGKDQSEVLEKPAILLTGAHHARELVSI